MLAEESSESPISIIPSSLNNRIPGWSAGNVNTVHFLASLLDVALLLSSEMGEECCVEASGNVI
jgi:hypothetical protein